MLTSAIAVFIERHPIMSFLIIVEVAGATRDMVVGISQAITGNYPPEKPKPEASELPKVDISITKPSKDEESEEPTEEVEGEVAELLA